MAEPEEGCRRREDGKKREREEVLGDWGTCCDPNNKDRKRAHPPPSSCPPQPWHVIPSWSQKAARLRAAQCKQTETEIGGEKRGFREGSEGRHVTLDMTDIAVTSSTQLYKQNVGEMAETKVGGWHSGVVVSSVCLTARRF